MSISVAALSLVLFFRDANLVGTNFTNTIAIYAQFEGARFSAQTRFDHAWLTSVDFHNCISFAHSTLTHASFASADLGGANLHSSSAKHAKFTCVNFDGATMTAINASSADFASARMSHAVGFSVDPTTSVNFRGADLSNADLRNLTFGPLSFGYTTNLKGTNLAGARLDGCDFSGMTYFDTDFTGASVVDAKFNSPALTGCKFVLANLCDANLSNVKCTQSVFVGS